MKPTRSNFLAISAALLIALPSAHARTRPRYGGVLRIQTRTAAVESVELRSLVAESLTTIDENGRVQPNLAERWESQNGNRRWQFFLRPGVTMHDGTNLNGSVVAEILTASPNAHPWGSVQGDGLKVTFESDDAMLNLPALLSSRDYIVARRQSDGALIGTGPYRIASAAGRDAMLDVNLAYWHGRGFADHIEIDGGRNIRSQWLDLGVGRADIAEVPAEFLRRAQQEHLRVAELTTHELVAIVVSTELTDVKIRHAISASIDRAALAGVIFQKQGEPASALLPDSMTGYATLFPTASDPVMARQLSRQVSVALPLTIAYDASDPTLQLAAERIVLNARDAGLGIRAVARTPSTSATLDLVRIPLDSPDPSVCLMTLSSHLLGDAVVVRGDQIETLYRLERELVDNYQIIPLLHTPRSVAVGDRVHDLLPVLVPGNEANLWIEVRP